MLQELKELFLNPDLFLLGRSVLIFLAALIFLSLVHRIVWAKLTRVTEKTHFKWDELLVERTKTPVRTFILFLAIHLSIQWNPHVLKEIPWATTAGKVLSILIGCWLIDRVGSTFFRYGPLPAKITQPTRTLFVVIQRTIILSIGFLASLDALGISITPLLASLGVGSVAIAFALQETLGNLFNGLYLYIDRPIREGDYVKLSDTAQGIVKKIGWRSTHLELLSGNLCIIPNSKIAAAEIVNFNFPNVDVDVTLAIGVAYHSNLDHVEEVCVDETIRLYQAQFKKSPSSPPVVRFREFGDSSINFNLALRVPTFSDQFVFKHELIKAIHKRFSKEKIEIPYPHRVVQTEKTIN